MNGVVKIDRDCNNNNSYSDNDCMFDSAHGLFKTQVLCVSVLVNSTGHNYLNGTVSTPYGRLKTRRLPYGNTFVFRYYGVLTTMTAKWPNQSSMNSTYIQCIPMYVYTIRIRSACTYVEYICVASVIHCAHERQPVCCTIQPPPKVCMYIRSHRELGLVRIIRYFFIFQYNTFFGMFGC